MLPLFEHASITALGSAVDDIRRVLEFATTWQRDVDRRAFDSLRLRSSDRTHRFDDSISLAPGLLLIQDAYFEDGRPLNEFERMAYREANNNAQVTVASMKYENPLELVIITGGAVVVFALLAMLRDWPERRRLNRAVAQDYENRVIARERVRNHVVTEIEAGRLPIPSQAIEALLTDDVANSLGALGDAGLDVRGLPLTSNDPDATDE